MNQIRLPHIAVTAKAVHRLVGTSKLDFNEDPTVKLFARAVANNSRSFTTELARELHAKGCKHVELYGASQQLTRDLAKDLEQFEELTFAIHSYNPSK